MIDKDKSFEEYWGNFFLVHQIKQSFNINLSWVFARGADFNEVRSIEAMAADGG